MTCQRALYRIAAWPPDPDVDELRLTGVAGGVGDLGVSGFGDLVVSGSGGFGDLVVSGFGIWRCCVFALLSRAPIDETVGWSPHGANEQDVSSQYMRHL